MSMQSRKGRPPALEFLPRSRESRSASDTPYDPWSLQESQHRLTGDRLPAAANRTGWRQAALLPWELQALVREYTLRLPRIAAGLFSCSIALPNYPPRRQRIQRPIIALLWAELEEAL